MTCTNGCPVVLNYQPTPRNELDLLPHQIMYSVRLGLKDLVLESRMLWACTECYMCTEYCPQGIQVCDVIYELGGKRVSVDTWFKEIKQDWKIFFIKYELKNLAVKERKNLIPRGLRIFANTLLDQGRTAEIMDWEREDLELPDLSGAGDEVLHELLRKLGLPELIEP